MSLKNLLASAALAAAACLFANGATAAPLAASKDLLRNQASVVQPVHYRSFRHCHRRWGYRRCHGGYAYYGYRPGVFIGFGSGRRHWGGHHRFHGHRGHHRH
jgi:hypothetical protein